MAKATTIKVKLVSSADTGFYYVTRKNSRTMTDKLVKKKYDPVAKKHVEFRESKLPLLISPAPTPQQPRQVYRVSRSSPLIDRYSSRSPWVHFQ